MLASRLVATKPSRSSARGGEPSAPLTRSALGPAERAVARAHPMVAALVARHGPSRLTERVPRGSPDQRRAAHFDGLCHAIASQQLSSRAADTIYGRVRALAGDERGLVTPARLGAVPDEALRGAGLSGSKVRFLRSLARHVEGGLDLVRLEAEPDDAVVRALVVIDGVGVWTAEMFLMFRLGRPDVLPLGDLGVRRGLATLYRLRRERTPAELERLAEPFRPHRSTLSWYLWRLGEEAAPRAP
jgi:DNA-3-methyladenine glycosylase II